MKIAVDMETHLITPGRQAPPLVCVQAYSEGWMQRRFVLAEHTKDLQDFRFICDSLDQHIWMGHNISFDMAVLVANYPEYAEAVFRAYEEDRVICTKVNERLIRIATGEWKVRQYSLAATTERWGIDNGYNTNEEGQKEEYWRTRYSQLEGIPSAEWPPDAVRYCKADVVNVWKLEALQMERHAAFLEDRFRQARADFWLHLSACWGMRTDGKAADRFLEKVEDERASLRERLYADGLVNRYGKRDVAAARKVMAGLGSKKVTKTGALALDKDTCEATGDQLMMDYARYGSIQTLKARASRLKWAADLELPIQPRYNVLMETGRTSCSKGETRPGHPVLGIGDQIQNVNREPGLRECFVPRPGRLLLSCDWSSAEMHTVAQVMYNLQGTPGELMKTLNAGRDPHCATGANILGITYKDMVRRRKAGDAKAKNARQMAKAPNFGFPGGMGAEKFTIFAWMSYRQRVSLDEAYHLKRTWLQTYPEFHEYFRYIGAMVEREEKLIHFYSKRFRGGATYCASCNSLFQGLAADMAKDCGFQLARRMYTNRQDVLYDSRIVGFIHDEFLVEVPEDRAHEAALAVQEEMEAAGARWCPDVPVKAEPALMRRWQKAAEPVWKDGALVPWEDR